MFYTSVKKSHMLERLIYFSISLRRPQAYLFAVLCKLQLLLTPKNSPNYWSPWPRRICGIMHIFWIMFSILGRTDLSVYDVIILQYELKNELSGLLICFKLILGVQSVVVAGTWMPINKNKMSLFSVQITVGMVFFFFFSENENETMHAHRMWEKKDYSYCVTDKRTGKQTDWGTCLSSHSP